MHNSTHVPTADPWLAVYATAAQLRAEGIPTRLDGDNIGEAKTAAEALLRAFGVEPVPTPEDAER